MRDLKRYILEDQHQCSTVKQSNNEIKVNVVWNNVLAITTLLLAKGWIASLWIRVGRASMESVQEVSQKREESYFCGRRIFPCYSRYDLR
jgi:hypothetical protein